MGWRTVVIANRAKLDLKLGYMIVRGETVKKIYLSEVDVLIVESTAVSLTAALLSELSERKIKVIFCDTRRNPVSELVPYYGCHDTSLRVRSQMGWSRENKALIWTEIVREKILKQAEFLSELNKSECGMLKNYASQLTFGDETNREGHSAKVYFNALFNKDFSRSDDCVINAALNYGYSVILSMFNREIVANGYITQIGLFHNNMFNQFNLASDLMEPFRVLVDRVVYNMHPELFDTEQKHTLVNIINKEVRIDGKSCFLSAAVRIYCRSVFNAVEDGDVSLLRFYTN